MPFCRSSRWAPAFEKAGQNNRTGECEQLTDKSKFEHQRQTHCEQNKKEGFLQALNIYSISQKFSLVNPQFYFFNKVLRIVQKLF